MKVDISAIIKVTGAEIKLNNELELESAEFLGETYKFAKPLRIEGEIYNNGQSLVLAARVKGKMVTNCARCLKEMEADVDFEIHELLRRAVDNEDIDEDMILFDGHEIVIDDIVADRFLMNISGRYLCSEDCLGLCPTCGINLNENSCNCDNEYIDPRWQALADILNQQGND